MLSDQKEKHKTKIRSVSYLCMYSIQSNFKLSPWCSQHRGVSHKNVLQPVHPKVRKNPKTEKPRVTSTRKLRLPIFLLLPPIVDCQLQSVASTMELWFPVAFETGKSILDSNTSMKIKKVISSKGSSIPQKNLRWKILWDCPSFKFYLIYNDPGF